LTLKLQRSSIDRRAAARTCTRAHTRLDPLRRVRSATLTDNAVASQVWNALDQLTQATDPKLVATSYTYDAFGEVLSETSPDSGTMTYVRDAAGNLISDGLRVFEYDAQNRHSKTVVNDPDEGSKITYLHNALGQRVFKSEPTVDHVAPNAAVLGQSFVDWLLTNFGWRFAQAQLDATLGQAYVYDDGQLGSTPMLLGEYGNGGSNAAGRSEYIWLPTESGQAIPMGLYKEFSFSAIHSDHLGTPRRMTNSNNYALWQWPYSAFGDNAPSGMLTPTTDVTQAFTNDTATATKLATTGTPDTLNLRFPGQYFDDESKLNYNYFRSYQSERGGYTQMDPIGLAGGWNRTAYANGNPLSFTGVGVDPISRTPYCSTKRSPKCPNRIPPSRRTRRNFESKWSSSSKQGATPMNWPVSLAVTSPAS
jgi:RHS repeat-associated protein